MVPINSEALIINYQYTRKYLVTREFLALPAKCSGASCHSCIKLRKILLSCLSQSFQLAVTAPDFETGGGGAGGGERFGSRSPPSPVWQLSWHNRIIKLTRKFASFQPGFLASSLTSTCVCIHILPPPITPTPSGCKTDLKVGFFPAWFSSNPSHQYLCIHVLPSYPHPLTITPSSPQV